MEKSLRIGFDAKRAFANNTGLGNYSRLIIGGISAEHPEADLLLYTPKYIASPRMKEIESRRNVEIHYPSAQGFKGGIWRTFGITNNLKADRVDIYHGLSNELPLNIQSSGVPSIVTIHDVIYRRLPYCYKPIDRIIYDYKYGRSCKNATHIIAVSERTKRDIVELYGIDERKISVVYQGCEDIFRVKQSPLKIEATLKKYNLPKEYILQVGTIEKRKNLGLTIRALKNIDGRLPLVAVGRDHYGYKKECMQTAAAEGVADRIYFLEGLPFEELPILNQGAAVICYPSRYEGFGIPVLEGVTSGRPVVAAAGSCLEEAGGEGAIYINPDSPHDMAEAVNSILRGDTDVEKMLEAGQEHSRKFNTSDIASNVFSVYRDVLAGG
ncbi:MAG: glycosyltransferase family 4 protein [Candidatus Amulumruptor caecigallinarius]|nr:glycosyltransferase family 4 protein [Candidatus Amulumruptor caecigallinarius]